MGGARDRRQEAEEEEESKDDHEDPNESKDPNGQVQDSPGKSSNSKLARRYRGVTKCGPKWRGNVYLPPSLVGKKEWKNVGVFDWCVFGTRL
jgi:hypothetical protein